MFCAQLLQVWECYLALRHHCLEIVLQQLPVLSGFHLAGKICCLAQVLLRRRFISRQQFRARQRFVRVAEAKGIIFRRNFEAKLSIFAGIVSLACQGVNAGSLPVAD